MAKTDKTIAYRIPPAPVGQAYYRKGTLYEPGSVVRLPADEIPPGWCRAEDGSLCPFRKNPKTGKIMPGKRHPHAWLEEKPGLVKSLEERDARQAAREEIEELRAQIEEKLRLLEEAETQGGGEDGTPEGGESAEGDAGDGEEPEGEGAAAEGEPGDTAGEKEGGKKKGRKRAADAEL